MMASRGRLGAGGNHVGIMHPDQVKLHKRLIIFGIIIVDIVLMICMSYVKINNRQMIIAFFSTCIASPTTLFFFWYRVRMATYYADRLRRLVFRVFLISLICPTYDAVRGCRWLIGPVGWAIAVIIVGSIAFALYSKFNIAINNFISIRTAR